MSLYEYAYGNDNTGTPIGKEVRTKKTVRLRNANRSTHVIGGPDMGKSNLLRQCILEDIARNDKAIVVLDPHTDLARAVAYKCPPEHAHRVVYFNPHYQYKEKDIVLGFNPFQVKDLATEYEEKAQAILDVFAHSWYGNFKSAPLMQNTLETLSRTLLSAYPHHATSFLHMLLLTELTDLGDYWRNQLSSHVAHNAALSQNWREWASDFRRTRLRSDIESSRQKIKHVVSSDILSAILCQPTSAPTFDFQDLIARKGVLLVALRGLEREGIRLIGSFILTQLLATVKLTREDNRFPCHIYADEFHNFSPESFVEIIDQARKFNLFCTMAHQRLNQLNDATISAVLNCENSLVFRVHPEDAQKLRKHFTTSKDFLSPRVLTRLRKWNALVKLGNKRDIEQACITTFEEKLPENKDVAKVIAKHSLAQGRPLAEITQYRQDVQQTPAHTKDKKTNGSDPKTDTTDKNKKPPADDDESFRRKGKGPTTQE